MCVYVCVCVHALMRMGRECKHELARSLLGVGDDGVKGLCRGADVDEDAALRPGVHLARPVDVHARERVLGALGERARRVLRRAALLAEQAAVVAAAAHRSRDRRRRRHRVVGVEHACRVVLVVHQALQVCCVGDEACAEGCEGGWEQTIAEYSRSFSSALGMLLSLFPVPWGSVPLGRGVTLLIVVVIPGACFTKAQMAAVLAEKEKEPNVQRSNAPPWMQQLLVRRIRLARGHVHVPFRRVQCRFSRRRACFAERGWRSCLSQ